MCIGCCHVSTSLQASCVLAVVMHSPESTSRPPTLLHSMHALLTTTVHSQNRSLQASCVVTVVTYHQNRPPGHPHCCTACMHCLQPTQNRSLQASCVLAVVMHSPESSRPFTLLHSMHALLTATVHRQNRSLQASCVLAVVHALIDIAAHCSQPLYTVKVGHCKPLVYQDTVSSKAI